jgi:hypothetical protein
MPEEKSLNIYKGDEWSDAEGKQTFSWSGPVRALG